jgi:hypothetical protein
VPELPKRNAAGFLRMKNNGSLPIQDNAVLQMGFYRRCKYPPLNIPASLYHLLDRMLMVY